jgi:hypothetical protein
VETMTTCTGRFAAAALAAALCGCGGGDGAADRPDRVPVTGTVTHQQKPVEGATVMFSPVSEGYAAIGLTDAEGRFSLQTFDPDDGAVPGEYRITVRKVEMSDPGAGLPDDADRPPAVEKSLLPARYADASTSGLVQTVKADGENEFPLTLEEGSTDLPKPGQQRRSSGE